MMNGVTRNPIQSYVDQLPIVDVHEHHIPDVFLNRNIGLLDLFQQSYAGWTLQRPYPLPSESREEDPMLADSGPGSWEQIAQYTQQRGSSHFVRKPAGWLESAV